MAPTNGNDEVCLLFKESQFDKELATKLKYALKFYGISVWTTSDIRPGTTTFRETKQTIEAAKVVIFLLSNSSIGDGYLIDLASEARKRGQLVIPVVLEYNVTLPYYLSDISSVNLSDWNKDKEDPRIVSLSNTIRERIRNSPTGLQPIFPTLNAESWIGIVGIIVSIAIAVTTYLFTRTETPTPRDTPSRRDNNSTRDTPAPKETFVAKDKLAPRNTPTPTETPSPTETPNPIERISRRFDQKISFRNTATRTDTNSWNWTVYAVADEETLSKIECIQYSLHETFPDPLQQVCTKQNNFAISANGWGEFNIGIKIYFNDGTLPLSTSHYLRLSSRN